MIAARYWKRVSGSVPDFGPRPWRLAGHSAEPGIRVIGFGVEGLSGLGV